MSAKNSAASSTINFQESLIEYQKQLAEGTIKTAYKGLMGYLDGLRLHFEKKYPDFFVSSSVQPGEMDFSYFYFFPTTLKQKKLKIVLLFVHENFRFEVWLAGYNKAVQAKYWKLFKEANYTRYPVPLNFNSVDSILEHVIVENADFSNQEALTKKIEDEALEFIKNVEMFLSSN